MSVNRISKFLLLALVLITATVSLQAQDDASFSYAAVVDNQLWVYPSEGDPMQIDTTGAQFITGLDWSEDGTLLAYIIYDENYESKLLVTNVADGTTQEIAAPLEAGFPVSFQADNRVLYAQYNPNVTCRDHIYEMPMWHTPGAMGGMSHPPEHLTPPEPEPKQP